MTQEIEQLLVTADMCLREVMERIDLAGLGIALQVDAEKRFIRTITDGDLRRAILDGLSLDSANVEKLASPTGGASITAQQATPREEQLEIMLQAQVRHLPLLRTDGTVAELASSDTLVPLVPMQAVIMAGGFGTRLRPLTDDTPKPMLPVGGKPLMERTIEGLERAGITRINVTTHYLPEKITRYFGSGSRYGVELNYVAEDQPLGTAGAIRLMDEVDEPLLVMNGDILTNVDYRSLLKFHQEHEAALTVAVRQYDVQVPYGVVEAKAGLVQGLKEKPQFNFLVNAGIYLLEPKVRKHIPFRKRYDMTDLIDALLENNETVVGYPIMEYWMDIGRHDDFQKAEQDISNRKWAA
ncbi:MAG: nucleotidyltransferase family protein [Pirellulales bacterium]|nr:nucleotidyltransferase family protein [Pirellulales bacterium]